MYAGHDLAVIDGCVVPGMYNQTTVDDINVVSVAVTFECAGYRTARGAAKVGLHDGSLDMTAGAAVSSITDFDGNNLGAFTVRTIDVLDESGSLLLQLERA